MAASRRDRSSSARAGATIRGFRPCWRRSVVPTFHLILVVTITSGKAAMCRRSRALTSRQLLFGSQARKDGPGIGKVCHQTPLLPLRAFIDIGGCRRDGRHLHDLDRPVGRRPRSGFSDYYESRPARYWRITSTGCASRGYSKQRSSISRATAWQRQQRHRRALRRPSARRRLRRGASPVKNQGRGAAMMRIEALRRPGPQIWWNEDYDRGQGATQSASRTSGRTSCAMSASAPSTTGQATPPTRSA